MLEDLRQKPEHYRHKVALSGALVVTLMIFSGWAFSKGFFGFGEETILTKSEVGKEEVQTSSLSSSNSPVGNTKNAFSAAFEEIGRQYQAIKESMASVLVPFVTGIEVYDKPQSE